MFGNSIVSCQLGDSIEDEAAIRRDTDTVVDLVAGVNMRLPNMFLKLIAGHRHRGN